MNLDPKQTRVLHEWKHDKPLLACGLDPKGRYLFSSSQDYTLQRWNVEDGKKVAWEAHDSWVQTFAFSADGETTISGGCDDRMIFWKTATEKPEPIKEIVAHKGWVRSLAVQSGSGLIASGGNDHLLKLWSPDGEAIRQFEGHENHIYSVFFHPTEDVILSGDLNGFVHQWDVSTGKLIRKIEAKPLHTYNGGQRVHYGGIRDIALSPDGTTLALTGLHKATNPLGAVNEPLVMLFDWKTGKELRKQPGDGIVGFGSRIAFLNDGTEICGTAGNSGGHFLFFKPSEEKAFHKLKLKNTFRDMSIHPNGHHITTIHFDGRVVTYELAAKPA